MSNEASPYRGSGEEVREGFLEGGGVLRSILQDPVNGAKVREGRPG